MATILVVEDDPEISRYLATLLVSDGHVPLTASTPERAREYLRTEPAIDLLMLDYNLGKDAATGLALLMAVRRSPRHGTLAVIVCTGESKPEILKRFLAHRIAGFIKKPFHPQRLTTEIRRALAEADARVRAAKAANPPRLIRATDAR
jgi:CheY-like chemotaxis protein